MVIFCNNNNNTLDVITYEIEEFLPRVYLDTVGIKFKTYTPILKHNLNILQFNCFFFHSISQFLRDEPFESRMKLISNFSSKCYFQDAPSTQLTFDVALLTRVATARETSPPSPRRNQLASTGGVPNVDPNATTSLKRQPPSHVRFYFNSIDGTSFKGLYLSEKLLFCRA